MIAAQVTTAPLSSGRSQRRRARGPFIVMLITGVAAAQIANAVSCPSTGAKIEVCVDNQTAAAKQVLVAGSAVTGQITCTGPAPILGGYQHTFTAPAGQTTCFQDGGSNPPLPVTGGLVSGMYVHRIYYPPPPTPGAVPTPRAAQYQKGPVVFDVPTTGNRTWARIDWVIHDTVLTVTSTADSACNDSNCVPGSCTFRQAINKARDAGTARPVLINFDLPVPSTIALSSTGTGCGTLRLDRAPASEMTATLTIDGTDREGRPWIVGDRTATQANMQDAFPVRIDLSNLTRFQITKSGHVIKGLDVANSVAPGAVQANDLFLFDLAPNSTIGTNEVRAVRADGGNTLDCSGGGTACESNADLFSVSNSRVVTVRNTEGRSGLDKGLKAFNLYARAELIDSWLHHNYRGNVQASGNAAAQVSIADSVVELAGRRATDGIAVNAEANGAVGQQARINSSRSIFDRNRGFGLTIREAVAVGRSTNDVACGNGLSGISIEPGSSSPDLVVTGSGAVYNMVRGVRLAVPPTNVTPFAESNAFVNNDTASSNKCDFENTSGTVIVNDSQWTNGVPRKCGPGTITTATIQNQVTVPIRDDLTADPSNALLTGQTVRIVGAGFNAVAGNAITGGCTLGDDVSANSCCTKGPQLANACPTPGVPPVDGGHCVEVQDRLGAWHEMRVDAVNPAMILTAIPQIGDSGSILPCTGGLADGDAFIRVMKRGADPSNPETGIAKYCTNRNSVGY